MVLLPRRAIRVYGAVVRLHAENGLSPGRAVKERAARQHDPLGYRQSAKTNRWNSWAVW